MNDIINIMELNTVSMKIDLTSFEFRSPETIIYERLIASFVNMLTEFVSRIQVKLIIRKETCF